ncbi:hypothetical protein Tco_1550156 [Tanacetum coccineum]
MAITFWNHDASEDHFFSVYNFVCYRTLINAGEDGSGILLKERYKYKNSSWAGPKRTGSEEPMIKTAKGNVCKMSIIGLDLKAEVRLAD